MPLRVFSCRKALLVVLMLKLAFVMREQLACTQPTYHGGLIVCAEDSLQLRLVTVVRVEQHARAAVARKATVTRLLNAVGTI